MDQLNFPELMYAKPDQIDGHARFLENYAQRAEDLDRGLLPDVAGLPVPQPAEPSPKVDYPEWLGLAATATAFAEAAQFALLLSLQEGQRLLNESGRRYAQSGLPFGYCLLALGRNSDDLWRPPLATRDQATLSLASSLSRPVAEQEIASQLADAMRYPGQQTYLFLALLLDAGDAKLAGRYLEYGLMNSGSAIGPVGNSVGDYWQFVRYITSSDVTEDSALGGAFSLAASYARAIRQAQRNRYLWEKLAAPVEILDLDLVVLSALMATLLSIDSGRAEKWGHDHKRDPIESIPISIGCQIAENGRGRPTRATREPRRPQAPADAAVKVPRRREVVAF